MDAATPEPIRATTLTPSDIRSIFFGIMLAMLLSALDQTIVATAMPTIGRELGDVEHLPWVVTSYLLASTAVTPLYGRFSDMHGRRVTLLIGITIFVVGSIACALAPNMLALILARGVQGLGGGGLIALAQTIVADMVAPRERGRYQVYFGAVFATASLAGPVLGGFFAQSLHWSVIFWINLPLGLLAFLLTNQRLKKLPLVERRHRLDVLGAMLLIGATTTFMLVLSWGGTHYAWRSAEILVLAAFSLVLWGAFLLRMKVAAEPLIPLQVFKDRVIASAILASAWAMATYIGLAIFVPIYFETVLGLSASQSGLSLIPLMIGIVIGSTVSGRLMARVEHYKRAPVAGVSLAILSIGTIALVSTLPFPLLLGLLFCASLGLGTVMPVSTVALQNAAPPGHLGTVTATMNFSRQLFGAVIVAVYGAIVLSGHGAGSGLTLETLAGGMAPEYVAGFRYVFVAATLGLAASLAFFLMMEERPLRDRPQD
ncbi:MDR family MFS transporter [Enterovirga sp. CN4-39]|uniref:MDR family MFS transporter n=1 Tax=Enterovirga sp. CN4-39 TaxID=3400910 RepID=UPI003C05F615